jgi:pyridoxal biosynthesis lyase PdxS
VWQSALAAHLSFRKGVGEVSGTTRRISRELSRLRASHVGIAGGGNGIFVRYVDHGEAQLRWIDSELAAATELAAEASEVEDPDMQLALLRLAGPRLEAAMMGSMLLAVWFDFLNLTDATLSRHLYGVETLYVKMARWQKMLEPSMSALASLEPEQVESAAEDMPSLVGHLTEEFSALLEAIHKGVKVLETALVLKESMEALTTLSVLKFTLPALRAATPATLGVGLMVGPNGVMMGTRIVVSAEWVEMMRQLVRAGVLSLPAVSAAVRIQAGQVMMARGHDDLPRGVRDALGDAPEVRAMRVTGKTGTGMAEPPRHHVMPKEFREWFEKRGFTGKMDINQFCVRLEQAHHEAIHGGGNWKLGRTWPGEWNRMLMEALYEAEADAGRMLTRNEILRLVAKRMRRYGIPMEFTRWRGP